MLAGKRAVRVGDQILKEIAELLARKINDPRVKGVTLTGIHMSNDLKHARVFYSHLEVKGDPGRVQSGFDSAKSFIKREIGRRVNLRYTPEIIFQHDPTLETGHQMEKLFRKIHMEAAKDADD